MRNLWSTIAVNGRAELDLAQFSDSYGALDYLAWMTHFAV
jgi:hypothetical protein